MQIAHGISCTRRNDNILNLYHWSHVHNKLCVYIFETITDLVNTIICRDLYIGHRPVGQCQIKYLNQILLYQLNMYY